MRMRWGIGSVLWTTLAISGALVLAGPSAIAFGAASRADPNDGQYLVGNLTWKDGKGGIIWGEAPAVGELGGMATGAGTVDEFRSAPVPMPLYVNASRGVHLYLMAKQEQGKNPCSGTISSGNMWVEVLVDGVLLAGGMQSGSQPDPLLRPTPPGFVQCGYRMGVERGYVPEGANITVRFLYADNERWKYGVTSEAPSLLYLPTWSPEEARYRMPEIFPRVRAPVPREAVNDVESWLARAGSAAAIVPLLRPRHGRATIASSSLLVLALAGCLGNPASRLETSNPGDASPGNARVSYEEPSTNGSTTTSTGTIIGQVSDPYYRPVAGAFVAVLRSSFFATTNKDGLFSFRTVPAGHYFLRVDKYDYTSLEVPIAVRANQVVRVDIQLAYDQSLEAGERPHRHDYWDGKNETVLFDAPIYGSPCTNSCQFYIEPKQVKDYNLVRPGTSELEIRITFDEAQTGYPYVGLWVQDNADASSKNWTAYMPKRSGEAWHVRTTWEMTDVGHQRFSTWTFAIDPLTAGRDNRCEGFKPAEQTLGCALRDHTKPFIERLVIVARRGAIPLEPAHPDHWRGETVIHAVPPTTWNRPLDPYSTFGAVWIVGCEANLLHYRGPIAPQLAPPERIIPPGTEKVQLYVNQSRANGGVPEPFGWELWYKTGEHQVQPYVSGSPLYRRADALEVSPDGLEWTWTIPLKEDFEADGMYNKRSAWRFVLIPDDWTSACADATLGRAFSLTWEVVAWKGPGNSE